MGGTTNASMQAFFRVLVGARTTTKISYSLLSTGYQFTVTTKRMAIVF